MKDTGPVSGSNRRGQDAPVTGLDELLNVM